MEGVASLNRFATVLAAILLVILSVAVFGYVSAMYPTIAGYGLADLRLGSLIWGLTYLLPKVLEDERQRPLLSTLQEIRKNLAFGKLDVSAAIRQTEIVLQGMTLSDLLQEDVTTLLALEEHKREEILQNERCIKAMLANIQELQNGALLSEEQKTLLSALVESARKHMENIACISEEYSSQLSKLSKRMCRIPLLDKDSRLAFQKILSEIKKEENETRQREESLEQKFKEFRDKWELLSQQFLERFHEGKA